MLIHLPSIIFHLMFRWMFEERIQVCWFMSCSSNWDVSFCLVSSKFRFPFDPLFPQSLVTNFILQIEMFVYYDCTLYFLVRCRLMLFFFYGVQFSTYGRQAVEFLFLCPAHIRLIVSLLLIIRVDIVTIMSLVSVNFSGEATDIDIHLPPCTSALWRPKMPCYNICSSVFLSYWTNQTLLNRAS